MQLHECLLLAVYPPGYLATGASEEEGSSFNDAADSESSNMGSSGSILLMVQCIISEWGSNAQTNFYIPAALTGCSTSSLLSSIIDDDFKTSNSISNDAADADSQSIMTCSPYIHPQLNLPVPQIQLPLYYGALCWSFTLAGVVMLSLPPNWTINQQDGTKTRHWFPYRVFAWILILWQVSLKSNTLLFAAYILHLDAKIYIADSICICSPNRVHAPFLLIMFI